MNKIQKMTDELINLAQLIIVAMVLIVVVYLIAQSLIGMVPATVGSIITGLAFVYIYATNQKVRESVNNWLKSGQK